jgi:hypothetical protein
MNFRKQPACAGKLGVEPRRAVVKSDCEQAEMRYAEDLTANQNNSME